MEYERTPDGQMQADFARRIGLVLLQYEQCSKAFPPEQRYEGTLTLALLQALLTNCAELLKHKPERNNPTLKWVAGRSLDEDPTLLGFQRSCVVKTWHSTRPLKYREILECLRNAMSHPCAQQSDGLPQTGYTSWQPVSGVIEGFTFTQSPWVNSSGKGMKPVWMSEVGSEQDEKKLSSGMKQFSDNYSVPGLTIRDDGKGHKRVFHEDQPFIPVLRLKLSNSQLHMLTLSLSEYLSAPLVDVEHQIVMTG